MINMDALVEFLKTNYIYFVFVAVILILALIGYIVDSSRNGKKKTGESKNNVEEEFVLSVPEMENAKIGETVNKNAGKETSSENVPPEVNPSNGQ